MIDKSELLEKVILALEDNLKTIVQSALGAKAAATNSESAAENKYDTRGLEASYLAGAQSKRAIELEGVLELYRQMTVKTFSPDTQISMTALIQVSIDGEDSQWIFLIPHYGGMSVTIDSTEIRTVTMDSPLGKMTAGKKLGDFFELKIENQIKEYEILEVQ